MRRHVQVSDADMFHAWKIESTFGSKKSFRGTDREIKKKFLFFF